MVLCVLGTQTPNCETPSESSYGSSEFNPGERILLYVYCGITCLRYQSCGKSPQSNCISYLVIYFTSLQNVNSCRKEWDTIKIGRLKLLVPYAEANMLVFVVGKLHYSLNEKYKSCLIGVVSMEVLSLQKF